MYSIISTENKIIDKETAIKMLNFNTYEHQRRIRPVHVKELAKKMVDGVYTGGSIVFAVNGDGTYMVDGQHTASAVVLSGVPISAVVKKIDCPTNRDLTLLWQQYDGGIPRGLPDYIRSELGALNVSWGTSIGALVAGAAVIVTHGFQTRSLTKSQKTALLKNFLTEGEFVKEIIGKHTSSKGKAAHLKRQTVAAVMIQSYQKSQEDAYIFWEKVKTGEMLSAKDPAYHLRNFLLRSGLKGLSPARLSSPREFYVKSLKAWNADRKNKPMANLSYHISNRIPKII